MQRRRASQHRQAGPHRRSTAPTRTSVSVASKPYKLPGTMANPMKLATSNANSASTTATTKTSSDPRALGDRTIYHHDAKDQQDARRDLASG
jgi:hypothetical protein